MKKGSYVQRVPSGSLSLWRNKTPPLRSLDIELTERCNNNCIHCCINLPPADKNARKKELTTAKIKEILTEAAALGCLTVKFTGGEPLLRDDFEALYLFARGKGLKVILLTNATLITPHLAETFRRIPPLENIEITVYGMKIGSYEAVSRTAGSFKAAFRGIQLLEEHHVPFVVKYTLLPPNLDEIKEFETWAETIPWMEGPPPYVMVFDLRSRRDSSEKNQRIKQLRLSAHRITEILASKNVEYIRGVKAFSQKFMGPSGSLLLTCGAGKESVCMDAYGYLQPCLVLRHPGTVYDLRRGSLTEALSRFFPEVRRKEATDPDYLNRCARCFLKGLCEQCPAKSWMEHGHLDRPVNYLCNIAHAQARHLGLIDENEFAWEIKNWRQRIGALNAADTSKAEKPKPLTPEGCGFGLTID